MHLEIAKLISATSGLVAAAMYDLAIRLDRLQWELFFGNSLFTYEVAKTVAEVILDGANFWPEQSRRPKWKIYILAAEG